jgi:hypothetical protein
MAMTPEQKAAKAKAAAKAQAKLIASLTPFEKAKVMRGLSTRSPEAKAAAKAKYKADRTMGASSITAGTAKREAKITADMQLRQAKKILAQAQAAQAKAAAAKAAAKATKPKAPKNPSAGRGRGGSGMRGTIGQIENR